MPRTHPSDAIFRIFEVSKDLLTEDDAPTVYKAISSDTTRSSNIGLALGLHPNRIGLITRKHGSGGERCAIAVINTWLKQDYNKGGRPYILDRNVKFPTWWSFVWAVADPVGGNNAALAHDLAQNGKAHYESSFINEFSNVDDTPFEKDARDAPSIASDLNPVLSRWYEMGAGLKMDAATLDLFDGTPQQNMIGMITKWIKDGYSKDPPYPNWRQLLAVVAASYGGGNPALAKELAEEHIKAGEENNEPMEIEDNQKAPVDHGSVREDYGQHHQAASPQVQHQHEMRPVNPDSGGAKPTLEDFVVYPRHKYNGGKIKPHGLALVIANEHFDDGPRLQRHCAEIDANNLERVLDDLGYRVKRFPNQTKDEIVGLFKSIGQNKGALRVEQNDDSFICAISTHGGWDETNNTDYIRGKDTGGRVYLQKAVRDYFGACEQLKGKPKLFFVQACRGKELGEPNQEYHKADTENQPPRLLPHESDILLSFATAPHKQAFRKDSSGSPYITKLCNTLEKCAHKMDLMTMVHHVHQELQASPDCVFKVKISDTPVREVRECPHVTESLRGPVFFFDDAEEIYKKHIEECLK